MVAQVNIGAPNAGRNAKAYLLLGLTDNAEMLKKTACRAIANTSCHLIVRPGMNSGILCEMSGKKNPATICIMVFGNDKTPLSVPSVVNIRAFPRGSKELMAWKFIPDPNSTISMEM